jgi:hypothetical protein
MAEAAGPRWASLCRDTRSARTCTSRRLDSRCGHDAVYPLKMRRAPNGNGTPPPLNCLGLGPTGGDRRDLDPYREMIETLRAFAMSCFDVSICRVVCGQGLAGPRSGDLGMLTLTT